MAVTIRTTTSHKSSCYAATALNGNGGSISKRKRSSDFKLNELVTIQVGIISGDEKEETLHIIRGSRLPIKIPKNAGSQEILKKSIEKHPNHDQFFCGVEDWFLLYPDQKKVEYIPGTNVLHSHCNSTKRTLENHSLK